MTPIFEEEKIFGTLERVVFYGYPVGQKMPKISTKSLYLTQLRRYKQFCVLLVKKIANA